MKFSKMILQSVQFRSVTFRVRGKKFMLACGWSLIKGDWWYENDPSDAKFFDIRKTSTAKINKYGIYIGRLGLALMVDK